MLADWRELIKRARVTAKATENALVKRAKFGEREREREREKRPLAELTVGRIWHECLNFRFSSSKGHLSCRHSRGAVKKFACALEQWSWMVRIKGMIEFNFDDGCQRIRFWSWKVWRNLYQSIVKEHF